ncbi:MAG: hypothetical protein OXI87_09535 [Albidovulum sp.]|nr:hypothetical protein [Albidovulum sp.]
MTDIKIEQTTFERLQHHARALVDTPDMVINRALDALELQDGHPKMEEDDHAAVVRRLIDPRTLPDLKHTKILYASLEGQRVIKPNWNQLLGRMLVYGMKHLANLESLRQICPANMVQGYKDDEGYNHLAEVDISFQGMSANGACAALVAVAQNIGIGLDITFMWRPKNGALHPSEQARLNLRGQPKPS